MTGKAATSFLLAAMTALFVGAAAARAQDAVMTGETSTVAVDTTTDSSGASVPAGRIASKYSTFLGSDSESVVQGLRDGQPIELTEVTPSTDPNAPPVVTEVTIEPPTGKMGWGNVDNTLDLARFQLAQAGISEPTPTELQAALEGGTLVNPDGTTTELKGILQMRADGMGWGQIAHDLDTNLGWIKSGKAVPVPSDGTGTAVNGEHAAGGTSGDADATATSAHRTSGDHAITDASGATSGPGKGASSISTASGETTSTGHGRGHADAITDASGATAGPGRGQGITDAAGNAGHGRGHGITDASGATGSERGRGITDAMGDTSGGGRGHAITDAMGSGGGAGHGKGQGITTAMGDSSGGSHSIVSGSGAVSGGGGHGGGHGANAIVGGDGSVGGGDGGGFGGGHGGGHGGGKH